MSSQPNIPPNSPKAKPIQEPSRSATAAPSLEAVLRSWARLGAAFNVAPLESTPDLERLLIDTIRLGRDHARLLVVAATWLSAYGGLVARHRLACLAVSELDANERAVLGWLLDEAAAQGAHRFREVRCVCAPAERTMAVFSVHARHPVLLRRVTQGAAPRAKRWNLLAEPLEPKRDAVRPAGWILNANPALAMRALLEGDLRCSILAAVAQDSAAGASELELARRCGASRAAVRHALARLELAGIVDRRNQGRRRAIVLSPKAA